MDAGATLAVAVEVCFLGMVAVLAVVSRRRLARLNAPRPVKVNMVQARIAAYARAQQAEQAEAADADTGEPVTA